MKIGTDISLQTCRDEGYTVIEFKVKDLYPNGKKAPLDKDCDVDVTISYPLYARDEMGWQVGDSLIMIDTCISWNTAYEMYLNHKESINSYCNCDYSLIEFPTHYDLLQLIDSVNGYCGI